ncbi:MAG: DUF3943 domain-containing protein [Pseudomonadota bacterium]
MSFGSAALITALSAAPAYAQDAETKADTPGMLLQEKLDRQNAAQQPLPSLSGGGEEFRPVPPKKDYLLPGLEIIAFDVLLNRVNNTFDKSTDDYAVTMRSWKRNLKSSWVIDRDPYETNQIGHPYQGAMYHMFGRSAGMSYWESAAYTFGGSVFWEIFGETTAPSRNDQIASGIAGSFLGESLFRMSSLVLERNTRLSPFWREMSAAAISPATGFNRYAFGRRFDAVFNSRDPAYYGRFQAGAVGTLSDTRGASRSFDRNEAQVSFAMDYGLPGKGGYDYSRPFDYFNFEINGSSSNGVESILNRGLIVGTKYEMGPLYRGIWGLYGSFDYIAPQFFRVSSTALSIGTTAQWWLTKTMALQGTGMAGIGYAAAGSVRTIGLRDYNYGLAPQALLSLRLVMDERMALAVNARQYYVSRVASSDVGGTENITRADVSLTMRLKNDHALALKYLHSRRDSSGAASGDQTQARDTIGLYYTLLGKDGFGTVDWR